MTIQVVTRDGKEVMEPFLLRISGWTEERFMAEAPEDRIWEFIDGVLIVHSPAVPLHQRIVWFLTFLLGGLGEERELGEAFNGPAVLHLRANVNPEPDIFFIRRERLANVGPSWVQGPADLVIEVISTSTRGYDLVEKAQVYLEGGVIEYWAVDSQRHQVYQHTREPGHGDRWSVVRYDSGRLASVAVPGFWIQVEWLWQEPLPAATAKLREIMAG